MYGVLSKKVVQTKAILADAAGDADAGTVVVQATRVYVPWQPLHGTAISKAVADGLESPLTNQRVPRTVQGKPAGQLPIGLYPPNAPSNEGQWTLL